MTASDDDRIAYLAGDRDVSLRPEDREALDELLASLAAGAAWAEPERALEDRVAEAIAAEASRSSQRSPIRWRRPRFALAGLAAALAATAIVLAVALSSGSSARQLRFAMIVSGTPLAPRAHGSATLTKTGSGWRIELSATGLPHLKNGRYYEAWLKNPAGILVPIGTFNDALRVTLWSGAPVTQFRTLTVTEQQANGNPASSGQRVLTGVAMPAH